MTDAPLLVHDDGNILVATLNRPEKLNALNKPLLDLLDAAIE
jgi:enoyl-CoA hydratase